MAQFTPQVKNETSYFPKHTNKCVLIFAAIAIITFLSSCAATNLNVWNEIKNGTTWLQNQFTNPQTRLAAIGIATGTGLLIAALAIGRGCCVYRKRTKLGSSCGSETHNMSVKDGLIYFSKAINVKSAEVGDDFE